MNKQIPGYTWMGKSQGGVNVGDIMVYDRQTANAPGHIMIVAEVKDATHFRMAEANEISSAT